MASSLKEHVRSARRALIAHLAESQHRNAYYLMLNTLTGAFAGVLFWFLVARAAGLPAASVGVGYAVVSLGTIVGVVAKGGLDTALVRNVPGASRADGLRLLLFAILVGVSVAVILAVLLGAASILGGMFHGIDPRGWLLVAAIGSLLVITWLQDAYFLAEGDAKYTFQRNLVFSAARIILPLPIVGLALAQPVALTWTIALAASAVAAFAFARGIPGRDGVPVPKRVFIRSALRNVSGGAAEFLPGLLLAPLVLALSGPADAAYFGIAWTAASLLFLASAAICRSALAEMVRKGTQATYVSLRRAGLQHLWLVFPGALIGAILAPYVLTLFGPDYAREAATALSILLLSTIVVAPAYFYLAYLRAREQPLGLVLFPTALVAALALLVPLLAGNLGITGVAIAWFLANTPLAAFALWKLRHVAREVTPRVRTTVIGRPVNVERGA